MADWPLVRQCGPGEPVGAVAGTSTGTVVLSHASANTKGSWVELIASTAYTCKGLLVSIIGNTATASRDVLVDIAIGSAGNEQIILPDLYGTTTTSACVNSYFFPISVPSGTRIAARSQCSTGSNSPKVALTTVGQSHAGEFNRVTAYGIGATSSGITVDPGGSANTEGAWSELTSSLTYPISLLTIASGNLANGVRTSAHWLADLAIGSAGNEQVILENICLTGWGTNDTIMPSVLVPGLPIMLPSGIRLSMRAQCDITDAGDRLFGAITYGVD